MALTGYLRIVGEIQQEIETNIDFDNEEKEGSIPIYSFHHSVRIPEQAGIQSPEMLPVHGQIVVEKQIDETTPDLYRALCTREMLTEVSLVWYEHRDGEEEEVHRIELEKCSLLGITSQSSSRGNQGDELMLERIEIYYRQIRWQTGDEASGSFFDFDTYQSLGG